MPPVAWNCENENAGSSDVGLHRYLLRRGVSIRQGVPEVEVVSMHIDLVTAVALILSVLLLGYLALTLLFPEKF
jgi:K+-transporting ATPase KdpF subunit